MTSHLYRISALFLLSIILMSCNNFDERISYYDDAKTKILRIERWKVNVENGDTVGWSLVDEEEFYESGNLKTFYNSSSELEGTITYFDNPDKIVKVRTFQDSTLTYYESGILKQRQVTIRTYDDRCPDRIVTDYFEDGNIKNELKRKGKVIEIGGGGYDCTASYTEKSYYSSGQMKSNCDYDIKYDIGRWPLRDTPGELSDEDYTEVKVYTAQQFFTSSGEHADEKGNALLSPMDVKMKLLDGSAYKAKTLLGNPDKKGTLYIGSTGKKVWIYRNKVVDNGKLKHLVLMMRWKNWEETVEDVKAVNTNQKAYFGIHYVKVLKSGYSSNSTMFK